MSERGDEKVVLPKLRFPEFRNASYKLADAGQYFTTVNERNTEGGFPILAITQEQGAVPRDSIDYRVAVTDASLATYKVVQEGDFIISLRSFQGGIERSAYTGVCSPAYIILRANRDFEAEFYRHYFKTPSYIAQLNHELEGIRDGKMISYSQFTRIPLPMPTIAEQRKIADCLQSLDELIAAQTEKLEALKRHKKGLLQQLFPSEGETIPRLRFPQFREAGDWQDGFVVDIGEVVTGTTPTTARPEFYGHDVPFVSPADISDDHYVKSTRSGLTILGASHARVVPPGSTFFVCIGSTIGKLAQCSVESATNQQINTVVPNRKRFDPSFVYYLLSTQVDTVRQMAGKQAVPLVNKTDFSAVPILFPLIEEQRNISLLLSELDNAQSATSENIATLRLHKSALMQQLFPHVEELDQ